MDTIRIRVPKYVISEYSEHPEPYGDYVVHLKNGMYTDVYKDDDSEFYTQTNDQDLIEYLKVFSSDTVSQCPYCGEDLLEDAKFCSKCGHSIKDQVVKESVSKKKLIHAKRVAIYSIILNAILMFGIADIENDLGQGFIIGNYIFLASFIICGLLILVFLIKHISINIPMFILLIGYIFLELVGLLMAASNILSFLILQVGILYPVVCLMKYYNIWPQQPS